MSRGVTSAARARSPAGVAASRAVSPLGDSAAGTTRCTLIDEDEEDEEEGPSPMPSFAASASVLTVSRPGCAGGWRVEGAVTACADVDVDVDVDVVVCSR